MKAKQAYSARIELEHTCASVSLQKWESLMQGAKKADGAKIKGMIKKQLPGLYEDLALMFPNHYESSAMRTDTHLIYVHSAIEYFLKLR